MEQLPDGGVLRGADLQNTKTATQGSKLKGKTTCVCACVCVYIYICIHIYICVLTIYIYIYICVCVSHVGKSQRVEFTKGHKLKVPT